MSKNVKFTLETSCGGKAVNEYKKLGKKVKFNEILKSMKKRDKEEDNKSVFKGYLYLLFLK